jgi:hypothetical protein
MRLKFGMRVEAFPALKIRDLAGMSHGILVNGFKKGLGGHNFS